MNHESMNNENINEQIASEKNGPEKITQDWEIQLKSCNNQLEEWKSKFLHLSADFDNFKRRLEKDQLSWQRMAQASIFLDLLTVIDDFDRALSSNEGDRIPDYLQGFLLIRKNFNKILEKHGVTEIKEMGAFDPSIHEAVMSVAHDEQHPVGHVVAVMQKGYRLKDQVLRAVKVSIAS